MPERMTYATARTRSLTEVVCLSACHQQGMTRSHGYRLLMTCTEACGPQSSRGLYLYLYLYLFYIYIYIYIYVHLHLFFFYLSIFLSIYLSLHIYIYVCEYTYIHVYICT